MSRQSRLHDRLLGQCSNPHSGPNRRPSIRRWREAFPHVLPLARQTASWIVDSLVSTTKELLAPSVGIGQAGARQRNHRLGRLEPLEQRRLLSSDYFPFTEAQITLEVDGRAETVDLSGPTFVTRTEPGVNFFGFEESQTQIHRMQLEGVSPNFGPVSVTLSPNAPSQGIVQEFVNNIPGQLEGPLEAHFQLFVLLDLPDQGIHAQNELSQPIVLNATLDSVPPGQGEAFEFFGQIPLVSRDPANPLPDSITLNSVIHIPRPQGQPLPFVEHDVFSKTVGQVLLEVPDAPVIVTPSAGLPPLEAVYMTAADVHATFTGPELSVTLANMRHKPSSDPPPEIIIDGQDEQERFDSVLEGTAVITAPSQGLDGVEVPVVLTGPVTTLVRGKAGQTTGSWQTEMVSMNLTGEITIPGGPTLTLVISESPTLDSTGQTSVSGGGGHFQIDSFFDIWTELSIDGGPPIPSQEPARVQAFPNGIQTDQPTLPPDGGVYRSATDVHAEFFSAELQSVVQILLQGASHGGFTSIDRSTDGTDEIETFQSELSAVLTMSNPRFPAPITTPVNLTGPVTTRVSGKVGETTGTFQTEMVSMDLNGIVDLPGQGQTVLSIREDVQLDSGGVTTIRDLPDGTFHIDSFFDVFTELSIDGGRTWSPATDAAPVHLHEDPERILVSGVGEARVDVYFDGPNEGDATDHDGDGKDDVLSQVVDMRLNGYVQGVGGIQIAARPEAAWPSLGEIEEQENLNGNLLDVKSNFADAGVADSFFDIWPQISMEINGQWQSFFTAGSTRVQSVIQSKPPGSGERYVFDPPQPVPLLTADGRVTPFRIVREIHDTTIVEHDELKDTTALLQLVGGPLGPTPQAFIVRGPANVDVFFEGPTEGIAFDDDLNGLDEVVTELVSMNLSDGNVTVRIRPDNVPPWTASLGRIEEKVNNTPGELDLDPFHPGMATSYFNVFFEIELPDGTVLHNQTGLRLEADISDKPPIGERYIHIIPPAGPLELYTQTGQFTTAPTGIFLVDAEHDTGFVEVDVIEQTGAKLTLVGGPIGPVPQGFRLAGSSVVEVLFEGAEGDADDDDGNNLDEVETELVQLNLSGGGISVSLNPNQRSFGGIEELVNNTLGELDLDPFHPGDADSFFDVFFQIDVGGGLVLHNDQPMRIESVIHDKPPVGERYIHILPTAGPIELLDENGNRTGIFLVDAEHDTGFVEVDVIEQTGAKLTLVGGPIGPVPQGFRLAGSSVVEVLFEGAEGDADDDDGNNLDEVETELVQLNLSGGGISVSLNPNQRSFGGIEELVNNTLGELDLDPFHPGDADSFFDVFFQIDVGGGLVLHNDQPMRIESVIHDKPPVGERYIHILPQAGPIELLDANDDRTGIFLVDAEHYTGFIEHDHFEDTGAVIELLSDNTSEIIVARGPTWVDVFFEGGEGDANDDGSAAGRDEVSTEMVQMNLTGTSSFGPVIVRLNPNRATTGEIEELVNNNPGRLDLDPFHPGNADSFFDVFFEIEVQTPLGPLVLHNEDPKRVSTVITEKPPGPGDTYESPETIRLYLENGEFSGYSLGATRHTPRPFVEHDYFEDTGAVIELLTDNTSEIIVARGPTWVDVFFEGGEGDANDDGSAAGRDEVSTEMVQMNLTGTSSFGPVIVRLNPNRATTGEIEELVNNNPGRLDLDPFHPGNADSFFDVFFEIEVQTPLGPLVLHNEDPKRVSTIITEKPPGPGNTYESPEIIPLYLENGEFSGYSLGATRHTPRPSLGPVAFRNLEQLSLAAGSRYYQLKTVQDGILSLQVDTPTPPKSARLRLYDADPFATAELPHLAKSDLDPDANQRIDWNVVAGETYWVEVYGSNPDFGLRIANLVQHVGAIVTVHGTDGDDVFDFVPTGSYQVTINGVGYHFDDAEVDTVQFNGEDGNDVASIDDSSGNDIYTVTPDYAQMVSPDVTVRVESSSTVHGYARHGGEDTAIFIDSPGNDKAKAENGDTVKMYSSNRSYYNRAKFFETVQVNFSEGGTRADARLWDSPASDIFDGMPGNTRYYSETTAFDVTVLGADFTTVYTKNGGNDKLILHDSPGDDVFRAKPHKVEMFDRDTGGKVLKITARGFKDITAYADNNIVDQDGNRGGRDIAKLYDSTFNDFWEAEYRQGGTWSQMTSATRALYEAIAFEQVKGYSINGGTNTLSKNIVPPEVDFVLTHGDWV